jgi:hypothetical protein
MPTSIERFTIDGIELDGVAFPLDAAVCATGVATPEFAQEAALGFYAQR